MVLDMTQDGHRISLWQQHFLEQQSRVSTQSTASPDFSACCNLHVSPK